ncbi:acetyltransferase, partial [Dickeya sp. CFBP 2040]|uniref:acetyltransferase n=1 Tax=Dickeya sp. CFBP 2040 TaxID=2718531 RepID=UPI00144757BC
PKQKMVRLPIFIRGGSGVVWGLNGSIGRTCRLETFGNGRILFGNNVQLNDNVHVVAHNRIEIGDNVLIASRVFITDLNHGCYDSVEMSSDPSIAPAERPLFSKSVIISKNVWIGEGAAILPGVVIGEGAIIGANAVVTRNIQKNSIAVGVPAKIIKVFDDKNKIWLQVNNEL